MFKHILLAIDDSSSGSAAVSHAIALAGDSGAVHVIHVNEFAVGGRGHTLETRQEAAAVLETALADLRAAGISASGAVVPSTCFNVARRITEEAHNGPADVIVVGSRRRSRLGGLRGKGMRERITGLTSLPVMTSPPPLRLDRRGRTAPGRSAVPRAPVRTPVGF
jgi:nucleotide-binding universal stress UspA family protein